MTDYYLLYQNSSSAKGNCPVDWGFCGIVGSLPSNTNEATILKYPRRSMTIPDRIPSANYHLWKPCNMRCGFCFATFRDIDPAELPKGHLGQEGSLAIVEALAQAGFRKLNFAGGEPTLCPWLPGLIVRAKELGLTTSVVTNGSLISRELLAPVADSLDWAALSIDSIEADTLLRTGRTTRSGPMSERDYLRVVGILAECNIRIKVNTVVSRFNLHEDLTGFIIQVRPERWKLLQVLPVAGQNDANVNAHLVSSEEFRGYVQHNRRVEEHGIAVVPETNDLMTGSYVMVDPTGRFFDNVAGSHTYSRSILEVGMEQALLDVSVDAGKFLSRSGLYAW